MTLPAALRELVLQNPQELLGLLVRAAASTLLTLGRDPKRLGAQLGITTVLHTWTRTLAYHPHVHCIVSGGGLSLDGHRWVATRPTYLFAVDVLRRLFRGRFMAGLCDLQQRDKLSFSSATAQLHDAAAFRAFKHALYGQKWVVYAKKTFGDASQVFAYLGRYTHRVGITASRLKHVDAETVRFTTREQRTTTMTPHEFIRRFLLHVLPKGFVKIRHYGPQSSRHVCSTLERARSLAAVANPSHQVSRLAAAKAKTLLAAQTWQERLALLTGRDLCRCAQCKIRTLVALPLPTSFNTS